MTAPTDAQVIEAVVAGDRAQFAVLVRRHNERVFRTCRAILRNDDDAEDAVQAAWLSAYRALASFRADASFRTWLTRIAVNEATGRLERQRRLAMLPVEDVPLVRRDDPADELFREQLARTLERELDALPESLRTVLVLRDVLELDTNETASALGIAEENVRVRLHRARQALEQRLSVSMRELVPGTMPEMWRFAGERCARVQAHVLAALAA